MPSPFIKEIEQANESIILDIYVFIFALKFVNVEHTSIEIRNTTIDIFKLIRMSWIVETVMEETRKETTVEGHKLVFTLVLPHPFQLCLQIVIISIKESFLLYEITEH